MADSKKTSGTTGAAAVPSKDLPPLPANFAPVFIRNQFRTTIPLPTRAMYPQAAGQRVIVTGANRGLGYAAASQLLALGAAHLIMGVRSLQAGAAAAQTLQEAHPSATIDVWELDMQSYASVRAFVQRCQADVRGRIDSVILNAGVGRLTRETCAATGHEATMQVNHYSTALLALLLLPVLKEKASSSGAVPPVVTVVNSVTAHLCKFPNRAARPLLPTFDDEAALAFDANERYGVSKLVSQLFLVALAERVTGPDAPVINMVDPGLTRGTDLFRERSGAVGVITQAFLFLAGRPVERGSATYVDAVMGHPGRDTHGCFLMNCTVSPLASHYYADKSLPELVWKETLQDAAFADAEAIIQMMQ